ncbi:hypothetical protein [Bacillus sp. FJAT-27264]|uniref:hypothetical protein n=1 Tax=Paenibacillus sp. (strain DSM 101736 / FJAT-27264) TaxID=1850362 RepID=UPI001586BD45|nr:hypothetical protein [Bacillus sp. FJAT-27264]
MLGTMHKAFKDRKEKIVEFRGVREKVQATVREFEVKTIHHNYYVIKMKGNKTISILSIEHFTIENDANCFVRGIIDPVNLNEYKLEIKGGHPG